MESKFFKKKIAKFALISILAGTALIQNNNNEIAASVAQDLTVYSGGGGGGPVIAESYATGFVGKPGADAVYYGDSTYIIIRDHDINPSPNYLKGKKTPTNTMLPVYGYMPADNYGSGGGVDTYLGDIAPTSSNVTKTYDQHLGISLPNVTEFNVNNARFVAGNGGQAANQDYMFALVNQYSHESYNMNATFSGFMYNGQMPMAGEGSALTMSINQKFNLEGSMYIKSGALGEDLPFTERTLVNPFNTNHVIVTKKTPRAAGGSVNLDFFDLDVIGNNTITLVRDSAPVNVRIRQLNMNSNAAVVLDSMNAVGGDSSLTLNSINFDGGTLSIDQTSNAPVDITGTNLLLNGRNFSGDLVYDLVTSPDTLTGNINLLNNATRLVEYRLVSDTGVVIIPNTQSSVDLTQYHNVHTIQAVFGFEAIFESNGGSPVAKQTEININERVNTPIDPTKNGFTFEGWFIDNALSIKYDFTTPVTQDITLYAKWTPVPVYHIFSFDSNGGPSVPNQSVKDGGTATEGSNPSLNGHVFEGWYTDNDFTTLYDFSTPVTQNVTVYAKWSPNVPANTIIHIFDFESNGGSTVPSQNVKHNDVALAGSTPILKDHEFAGWFTDNSFVTLYDFSTPVVQDTTVYAKWDKIEVKNPSTPDVPSSPNTPSEPSTPSVPNTPSEPSIPNTPEILPQTGIESIQLKAFALVGLGFLVMIFAKLNRLKEEI